ncbi:hypothetical protein N658DRAFT_338018 [Parathielavia hyrcaniae]|uniref:Secreted protein n=1 Tax=Parathielavia hyrcaniae TaxID=113614 RepID=A0AAN6Q414_9PEZI|nr:hypothetical protein N658DRAFT_338018 [Parathielavia hyrcaniae]
MLGCFWACWLSQLPPTKLQHATCHMPCVGPGFWTGRTGSTIPLEHFRSTGSPSHFQDHAALNGISTPATMTVNREMKQTVINYAMFREEVPRRHIFTCTEHPLHSMDGHHFSQCEEAFAKISFFFHLSFASFF